MKKLISILLLALYLFSVEGINLHRHFCGGSVADVSLFTHLDEENCCGDEPCNECYDDHVTFKINQEHVGKLGFEQAKIIQDVQDVIAPDRLFLPTVPSFLTTNLSTPFIPGSVHRMRDALYDLHCSWLI